jgi:hypothetical protein
MTGTPTGRRRLLVVLAAPTLRAVRWDVPATAAALVVGLLVWKHGLLQSTEQALWLVRTVALLLTVGALPLLDDPAARQVAAVPVPLAWRSAIRLAAFLALVFAPVSALAAWSHLPVGGLLLETSAVVALSCAVSALTTRSTEHSEPSMVVSLGLLPLPAVLTLLPPSAALLVPEGAMWEPAHRRWAVLLAVGLVALVLALRDPAARFLRRGRALS